MVIIIIMTINANCHYRKMLQNRADNIRNNKADNRAHTQVNTHTARLVLIQPLQR